MSTDKDLIDPCPSVKSVVTPSAGFNRRKFIATVATGSVATQLPTNLVAAEAPANPPPTTVITADTLAAGEALAGILFTPKQREPLVKGVSDRAIGLSS